MTLAFLKTIPIMRIFDVEKAKDFYIRFLGFALDWEHKFDTGSPVYLQISKGDFILHLSEHHGDCCPGSTVFVWMKGIEAFHETITSRGYGYMRPGIERTFYNSICVEVTDPFGNRIRFNEEQREKSEDVEQSVDDGASAERSVDLMSGKALAAGDCSKNT